MGHLAIPLPCFPYLQSGNAMFLPAKGEQEELGSYSPRSNDSQLQSHRNNEAVHLLNELKSFLYFLFSLLSLHYSCCRGRRKKQQNESLQVSLAIKQHGILCVPEFTTNKMFQTRCPEHRSPRFIHTADKGQPAAHFPVSAFSHMPLPGYTGKEESLQFEL